MIGSKLGRRALLVVSCVGFLLGTARAELVLSMRGGATLPLVLAKDAAPSLSFAAKEWNRYLAQMTGERAKLLTALPKDGRGVELVMEALTPGDEDSFTLVADDRKLTIRGGTRGILYGVYEVLETYGGVGWYASFYTHVPRLDRFAVPTPLDRREVPAFDVRWPGWVVPRDHDGHWAVHLRLNGTGSVGSRPQFGGVRYRFARGWTGHTLLATSLSDGWRWYDLGTIAATESGGFGLHVGRVAKGGDGVVASLVVDGVEFSKVKE